MHKLCEYREDSKRGEERRGEEGEEIPPHLGTRGTQRVDGSVRVERAAARPDIEAGLARAWLLLVVVVASELRA